MRWVSGITLCRGMGIGREGKICVFMFLCCKMTQGPPIQRPSYLGLHNNRSRFSFSLLFELLKDMSSIHMGVNV